VSETAIDKYAVSFRVTVENVGQVTLSAVNLQENLALAFPAPVKVNVSNLHGDNLAVNRDFDGVTVLRLLEGSDALAPGEQGTVSFTLDVSQNGGGAWFESQVLAFATAPDGTTVMDFSQAGEDVDPDGDGDPTNNNHTTNVLLAATTLSGFAETTVRVAGPPLDVDVTSMLFNTTVRIDDFSGRAGCEADEHAIRPPDPRRHRTVRRCLRKLDAGAQSIHDLLHLVADIVVARRPRRRRHGHHLPHDARCGVVRRGASLRVDGRLRPRGDGASRYLSARLLRNRHLRGLELGTMRDATLRLRLVQRIRRLRVVPAHGHGGPCLGEGSRSRRNLDIRIAYTEEEKSLTPSLRFEPDWIICPEIVFYGEAVLAAPGTGISADPHLRSHRRGPRGRRCVPRRRLLQR